MKKLALCTSALGLGMVAVVVTPDVNAADHLDSPSLTNKLADINDVYAWMTTDGKLNLVMTVSPGDNGALHFGPGVLYAFHVTSKAGLGIGQAGGTETKIICKFASDLDAKCWIGDAPVKDYVEGDPSGATGVTSFDNKVRLFAGRRSDPFFFNLQGFRDAITLIKAAVPTMQFDLAGCPNNQTDVAVAAFRAKLQEGAQAAATAPCATDHADCFKHLKVKAIVLQIDKSLVLETGQTVVGVWASTHMGS